MKVAAVLILVLFVLLLMGQCRVGCKAEYSAEGPKVWLRLAGLNLQVFPMKPRETKEKKTKKGSGKEKTPVPFREKAGGLLCYAEKLLPVVLEAAGQFYQKLQVDTLRMRLTVGGADPADAAVLYGRSAALLGTLWYPLTEAFHVKDGSAKLELDFDAPEATLYMFASLSLKISQILWLGLYFGVKALRAFLAVRKHLKQMKLETQGKAA